MHLGSYLNALANEIIMIAIKFCMEHTNEAYIYNNGKNNNNNAMKIIM